MTQTLTPQTLHINKVRLLRVYRVEGKLRRELQMRVASQNGFLGIEVRINFRRRRRSDGTGLMSQRDVCLTGAAMLPTLFLISPILGVLGYVEARWKRVWYRTMR